jgi:hypothetical protein
MPSIDVHEQVLQLCVHLITCRYVCCGRLPALRALLLLQSFLAVPIIASGSSGSIIGALSFGLTSITDWGSAWWMDSIQLLCGWAAGALPQNRASARVCFFDALWSARDLDELGRCFVHQLPQALVDPVSGAVQDSGKAVAGRRQQQLQQYQYQHQSSTISTLLPATVIAMAIKGWRRA